MEDFLIKNKGGHEPGIIITLDESHTRKVEEWLLSQGFKTNIDLNDFVQEFRIGGNLYLSSLKIVNTSVAFDIVMGFASRQIQIDQTFISPKYQLTNFVLVFSRDFIDKELSEGRNWMSLSGIAIQAD